MWYINLQWNIIQSLKRTFVTTRMDTEGILLNEIGETEIQILYYLTCVESTKKQITQNTKMTDTEFKWVAARIRRPNW